MNPIVPALHALARRCVTAPSARGALTGWHDDVGGDLEPHLLRVSRRIALGASIEEALEPLRNLAPHETAAVARVLTTGAQHGSSLAVGVSRVASIIEERSEMADDARGAAVAARTSTRMLAIFAVAFATLLPSWRSAPPPAIVLSLAVATVLGWAGMRWVTALSPRPPQRDHPVAAFADALGAALNAGLDIERGLAAVRSGDEVVDADIARALRRRRMGAGWRDSFTEAADPSLRRLAPVIDAGVRSGAALHDDLAVFARRARYDARCEFELRAKKAPIMLVLPLTLCFLPAFAIAILVPLLGGLST
ncbi:MAG TPA: type II secretion system F family protein [Actinomycetota bacterium]|nr:type II secretion system F family protein [Actinomycetota bacterium]